MADKTGAVPLFGRAIVLKQPPRGHRAGTDAILLAAATPPTSGLIVDLGSGSGAAGLLACARLPKASLLLLDSDAEAIRFAQENIALNGLSARARAIQVDALSPAARRAAGVEPGSASVVIANPPFYEGGRVRPSPDPQRRRAHVLASPGGIADWLDAAAALARPRGLVAVLYRADRLDALIAAFGRVLGGLRILPIHPRADVPATRVLVGGQKGARSPLRLQPALVLHESDGTFTKAAAALHAGLGGAVLFEAGEGARRIDRLAERP